MRCMSACQHERVGLNRAVHTEPIVENCLRAEERLAMQVLDQARFFDLRRPEYLPLWSARECDCHARTSVAVAHVGKERQAAVTKLGLVDRQACL